MGSALVFERQYRTSSSEGYRVLRDGARLAQVELHFAHSVVYCTLILFENLTEHEQYLVHSAEVPREDLMVTVYHGQEVGFYNDDMFSHVHADEERQNAPTNGDDSESFGG